MRVLELSTTIASAYCGQMLALQGADVTRVDPAGASVEPATDALVWELLGRGKEAVRLDLRNDGERRLFLGMVAEADALVEDGAYGGLTALGLDEATLFARSPQLVLTRISEFGLTGPWAGWHGSELVNLAAGGLLFLTGSCDRPPVQVAPHQAQLTAGVLAAIATSAALYAGGPMTVDFSKQEAVLAMVAPALTTYAYTGVIEAREGTVAGMTRIEHAADTWVYAGPSSPTGADYTTFASFLGIPALAEPRFATAEQRMEHWEEHQKLILPRLRERTAREWVEDAAAWHFTFGYVQTTAELLDCPVLAERAFFATVDAKDGPVRGPLAPYLVDGERPESLARPVAYRAARATAGDQAR